MAKPTVIGFIFEGTSDLFRRTVENLYESIHDICNVPFHLMVILFIIFVGYSILTSKIELTSNEIFKIIITLVIVIAAFNAGDDLIPPMIELFIETPSYIAGEAISKSRINLGDYAGYGYDTESPFFALEAITSTTGSFLYEAISDVGAFGFGKAVSLVFLAFILGACVFYFTTMTVFTVIKSMLFIAILIATSPIAIVFSLFSSTRFIAQGWLSQLITYALSYFLVLILIVFVLFVADSHMEALLKSLRSDEAPLASNIFGTSIIMVAAAFSMKEIPSLAGAIGGGVSLADDRQFRGKARQSISTTTNWVKSKLSRNNTTTKS